MHTYAHTRTRANTQVAEERVADDNMIVLRGCKSSKAVTLLLRGANDYMLDEMDRSLHDSLCVVKRVLESGSVVPGVCVSSVWSSVRTCLVQCGCVWLSVCMYESVYLSPEVLAWKRSPAFAGKGGFLWRLSLAHAGRFLTHHDTQHHNGACT
jgi:hypothetical protein